MAGYTVQIEALGTLIRDLDTATERITNANNKLAGGGLSGTLGHERLTSAGTEFQDTWEYGIKKLGEAAEDVVDGLTAAKKKYQDSASGWSLISERSVEIANSIRLTEQDQ